MGNISCSVSGFGAGDASRKSLRGSTRSFQRQRASSSCCHNAEDWLIRVFGDQYRAKITRQERNQVTRNDVAKVASTDALEELLDDCASGLYPEDVDLDVASDCVSPFTDAGSGYFSDDHQLLTSLRDEAEEDEEAGCDELLVMCEEDKAMMMMMRTPTTICGEEWINWTAFCPCCRRDASDDSINLQEMIKLEPIRASVS